jgi:hypothetical protein
MAAVRRALHILLQLVPVGAYDGGSGLVALMQAGRAIGNRLIEPGSVRDRKP